MTDTTTNCSTVAKITLECVKDPIIPNVFTPNKDGFNDYFFIKDAEGWDISIQIYDRWGIKVFQDNNYKNNWDGKDLSDGVYYYIIKAINKDNGIKKEYNGSVTILR